MTKSATKSKPTKAGVRSGGPGWPDHQPLVVNHLHEEDFKSGGLRSYANYRDLGISAATNGMVLAHVIRAAKPFDREKVAVRHHHDVDFHMVYCLKGWLTLEFEGEVHTMRPGTCWLQPPSVRHTVLDYSPDYEVIEIIMPADFDTVLEADDH